MTRIATIDATTAAAWRAQIDRATAYAESIMSEGGQVRRRNYLTAEEAAHPDYAGVTNDMRGQVEQFEILNGPRPARLVAYIGQRMTERDAAAMGLAWSNWDTRVPVTTWPGQPIGWARLGQGWPVRSYVGSRMYQARARIRGLDYTGRTFGQGMAVCLRLTAQARRKAEAEGLEVAA